MQIAAAMAHRSRCTKRRVGATIVTRDNRVASVSYNGPAAREPNVEGPCTLWCPRAANGGTTADYGSCKTIHAESNGLLRANWTDIQGGTIYVTSAMCINCAKLVANSGLARVVHQVLIDDAHRDPEGVERYLRSVQVQVERFVADDAH